VSDTPRIIIGEDPRAGRTSNPVVPFAVVGTLGGALLCAGLLDLILLWIPLQFGVAEWEFGTVSRFLDGLPVLTVGLALLLITGALNAKPPLLWVSGILSVLVLAVVLVGILVYILDIPLALKATDPGLRLGLKKAVVKTLGEAVIYLVTYTVFASRSLRMARRPR
jgi:hypothetical protein